MKTDALITIIILVVIVGSTIIKKLKEVLEAGSAGRQDPHVDYEATPSEIQEFLRSITAAQQPQAAVERPEEIEVAEPVRQGGPARAAVRPQQARPAGMPTAARSFWDALEGPLPVAPVRPPKPKPQRRKKPRRQAPAKPVAEAPRPQAPPVAEEAKAAARVTPLALKGMDVKQAIIWSEILGRPVSLRRSSRRR